MRKTVYPDWVQEHRTQGTTVKKIGNSYYLYKRTSRRVPGKKYPQPIDSYIGIITPEGVVKGKSIKMDVSSVRVEEFGFSKTIWDLCPDEWKKAVNPDWEEKLVHIISRWSPNSYLLRGRQVKGEKELHFSFSAQAASLSRKFFLAHGINLKELEPLKYIYLVGVGKKTVVSAISEEQKQLISRLPVTLEYK